VVAPTPPRAIDEGPSGNFDVATGPHQPLQRATEDGQRRQGNTKTPQRVLETLGDALSLATAHNEQIRPVVSGTDRGASVLDEQSRYPGHSRRITG